MVEAVKSSATESRSKIRNNTCKYGLQSHPENVETGSAAQSLFTFHRIIECWLCIGAVGQAAVRSVNSETKYVLVNRYLAT